MEPTSEGYALLDKALCQPETFATRLVSVPPSMRRTRTHLRLLGLAFGLRAKDGRFELAQEPPSSSPEMLKAISRSYFAASCDIDELDWSGAVDLLQDTRLCPALVRRQAVCEALLMCETGKWYTPAELLSAAKQRHFALFSRPPRTLPPALVERLELAYVCAVCSIFLCTMGALDIALSPAPAFIHRGQQRTLLVESLSALRITPLGAWLLCGAAGDYAQPLAYQQQPLRILTNGQIVAQAETIPTNFKTTLSTYAKVIDEYRVQLDPQMLAAAAHRLGSLDQLRAYLQKWAQLPWPSLIDELFTQAEDDAQAVKPAGDYLAFACRDEALADRLCADPELRTLCKRVDERTLMVRSVDAAAFRERLAAKGFFVKPG
jgi:hypothetical protein